MSSLTSNISELQLQSFPRPRLIVKENTKKRFVDLTNPVWVLVIWDVVLGIPFSLLIALINKAIMQLLGYGDIMRGSSGVFAIRAIVVWVNLLIIWSWRKHLEKESNESQVRAEIKILDEVIVSLERVLAGVEVREIDEQKDNEIDNNSDNDPFMDKKAWQEEWIGERKRHAWKIWREERLSI